MGLAKKFREKVNWLKRHLVAVYYISKHPETPRLIRAIVVVTLGLALSPIDLVPDFIPVLGILDDLIIVPFGIYLTLKLAPSHIVEECLHLADNHDGKLPAAKGTGKIIVVVWVLVLIIVTYNILGLVYC